MLTGQAKADYQRDYMRRRRGGKVLDPINLPVRPIVAPVRPSSVFRPYPVVPVKGKMR